MLMDGQSYPYTNALLKKNIYTSIKIYYDYSKVGKT
jgi:hypothetical protein